MLLIRFLILFNTQMVIFEMLTRNMVDALYGSSESFRRVLRGRPAPLLLPVHDRARRRHLDHHLPRVSVELVEWAANMSNLAAMIFPFALIHLISNLLRAARARWWSYVLLSLSPIYFGFWFINFAKDQLAGSALMTF